MKDVLYVHVYAWFPYVYVHVYSCIYICIYICTSTHTLVFVYTCTYMMMPHSRLLPTNLTWGRRSNSRLGYTRTIWLQSWGDGGCGQVMMRQHPCNPIGNPHPLRKAERRLRCSKLLTTRTFCDTWLAFVVSQIIGRRAASGTRTRCYMLPDNSISNVRAPL